MISFSNRVFVIFCSALFVIAVGCYAYLQEIYFLAAPFILVLALLLIQYPQYLLYLLMISIPWSVEFSFNENLGTDLPDEPLMLLASLSALFYMVHQRKMNQWKKVHPLVVIIVLQFLWAIITMITSTDFVVSGKYLLAKTWYLLTFVGLPVFLFRDERVFKRSVLLLLCSMMAVTVVILMRQGINDLSFKKVSDSVRPFFRNHVNYSSLLVFMVPIQIAMIQLSSSKKTKTILFLVLILTVIATYFSYARGAWMALIIGCFAYWLLHKRLLFFSFLFFMCIVVAGVSWLQSNDRFVKFSNDYKTTIFHTDFRQHLLATYQLKDLSNAERIYRWVAGVRMIKDNWETGFGPSTFYHQYKSYTLPAFKTYVSDNKEQSTVHNYFLLMLVEQGIIGCLLFVTLIAALFWYAQKIYFRITEKFWKVTVAAAASVLAMQCVINFLSDMIETDKVGSIFYLCVATLIIADIQTRRAGSDLSTHIQSIS